MAHHQSLFFDYETDEEKKHKQLSSPRLWVMAFMFALAVVGMVLASGCAFWPAVKECAMQEGKIELQNAVLDIFSDDSPADDGQRMKGIISDLATTYGLKGARALVKCVVVGLDAALAERPPGDAASVSEKDAETHKRMRAWLAGTE